MAAAKRLLGNRVVLRVVGVVIGGVLVYASLDKIARPDRFADIVHDYDMLPIAFINAFALLMPWVEMAAGASLIVGFWCRGAGLLATALSVAFLVAIAQAELRGLKIECGCFDVSGMASSQASWSLFARDIPLLVGSVLVWRRG